MEDDLEGNVENMEDRDDETIYGCDYIYVYISICLEN